MRPNDEVSFFHAQQDYARFCKILNILWNKIWIKNVPENFKSVDEIVQLLGQFWFSDRLQQHSKDSAQNNC